MHVTCFLPNMLSHTLKTPMIREERGVPPPVHFQTPKGEALTGPVQVTGLSRGLSTLLGQKKTEGTVTGPPWLRAQLQTGGGRLSPKEGRGAGSTPQSCFCDSHNVVVI